MKKMKRAASVPVFLSLNRSGVGEGGRVGNGVIKGLNARVSGGSRVAAWFENQSEFC
ncbi:MAG: hypothetical protein MUO42_06405 [Anaerolineaceae bacterium]|nr:hypothetical protein [Anaerolineaceae bacterium]